jgi:undecaprenyl-diphosphatase
MRYDGIFRHLCIAPIMPIYQVVILAVIQGLTEFLPISSTAHLALTHWLFGWDFAKPEYDFAFDVALHAGTLLAIIIYFFRDWVQIIAQAFGIKYTPDRELAQNRALLWLIAIGSIPVGIAGVVFGKEAETTWRNPYVIATMLIAVGVLMWIGERVGRRQKDVGQVTAVDAGVVGLGQALAVVPGTSRSGITIAAGLFRNLDHKAAAKFSFLLSTPAIAAAALKSLYDLKKHYGGVPHEMVVPAVVGAAVSAVVGAIVIKFLLDYLRKHSLSFFVYYRIIFGIIVFALAAIFPFNG